ncbi:hypothetical protein X566_03945 [Afipia sp. P52-10]|nr:hypothetical protein X566_03945 [Afipia sp. P52-10]
MQRFTRRNAISVSQKAVPFRIVKLNRRDLLIA